MSIDALFSKTVYINLDRRQDRRERMRQRFESLGMRRVERISAVDGSLVDVPPVWKGAEGNYGCLRSHKTAVAMAEAEGYESLLVFEDDVEFVPDLVPRVNQALRELPDDWDFLYLGGSIRRRPVPLSDSVARATYTLGTFAYVVRRPAFEYFRSFDLATSEPIDARLAKLQEHRTFHCVMPNLVWVESDYSDIQRSFTNHWYIKESLPIGDVCDLDLAGRVALILPLDWPAWHGADPAVASLLTEHFREAIPNLLVLEDHGRKDPDPAGCARQASNSLGNQVDLILVAGSPVFFSRSHLLGALQMCQKCAVVSPFNEVVPLTTRDVAAVLAGRRRELDLTAYQRQRSGGSALHWGFFHRDAFSAAGPDVGQPIPDHYEVPSFGLYLETRELGRAVASP